jgi:CheY-like chemotaxis protein
MNCQNILIVEDNDDIRDSLEEVLRTEGYKTYAVKNGREAVAALKRITGKSLILLDIMMPVMDGRDFIEAQKADSVMATLPVVVVTALEAARALSIGKDPVSAVGYLRKPIALNALFEIVEQHCEKQAITTSCA